MVVADSDYEGSAIEALGSNFKVTQVFLWDDGFQVSSSAERKLAEADDNHASNLTPDWIELIPPEDLLELNKQMNDLGLPLSFHTNKQKNGLGKGKKKGSRSKHPRTCHNHVDETLYEVSGEENVSPAIFHDKTNSSIPCTSMLGQSKSSNYDGAMEIDMTQFAPGEEDRSACCTGFATGVSREINNDNRNKAATNNVQDVDFLISNVCIDLKNAPAPDTGISAGSHLTGADVNNCGIEYESFPVSSEKTGCDRIDVSNNCGELGDWAVFWDTFYMRRYFYNIKTQTSTWDPPSGMEHLAIGGCPESGDSEAPKAAEECGTPNNTKPPEETLIEENLEGKQCEEYLAENGVAVGNFAFDITTHSEDQFLDPSDECLDQISFYDGDSCYSVSNTLDHISSSNERCILAASEVDHTPLETMVIDMSGLDTKSDPFKHGKKVNGKKVKRRQKQRRLYNEIEDLHFQEMPEEYSATVEKYWCQRYILFSRFDDGVKMDEEGWFSVTPEAIARYQAVRCASGVIIDCFAGVGGNSIQFAQQCKHVIAIDIDPLKIDYARHNAAIYGVDDQIDFIMGDFFLLAPKLKADTVFLSPPWGGPDYAKVTTYDMKTMLRPHDGYTLFNVAKEIASRVVMFLPRNINFNQLAELCLSSCPTWSLEVEKVHLNGRLKAINAYFSDTAVGGC
ncbi:uncharacterized protein LOC113846547 isoform X4 [Abrus precatorius]|uniref:Trimethylguanosine synthase n=1 Tax=Abrus precatorius TaxID=3816 RepID=A0A8B8JH30_ABRPR|nr:uncharacterized protein LOC113846547 isoform X4 [Abrus precatorius]